MDEADAAATATKGAASSAGGFQMWHCSSSSLSSYLEPFTSVNVVSGGAAAAMDSRHDLSAVESTVFRGTAVAERRSSF